MPRFDKRAFVERICDFSYPEIILAADEECASVEAESYSLKGAVRARKEGSVRYATFLKGLEFWLRSGVRPAGFNPEEFHTLKSIAEALVRKGEFKPEALALFDDRPTGG